MSGEERLRALRDEIDGIDQALLGLLRARAALAIQAGRVKRGLGQPVHCPEREAEVLLRLRALGGAPLSAEALLRVYRVILAESRRAAELDAERGGAGRE